MILPTWPDGAALAADWISESELTLKLAASQ